MEPSDDIEHVCKPFCFKNRHAKWPTCNWKKVKYSNGGDLSGVIRIGDNIHFESYKWCENLKDGELKDEALNCKAKLEESMNTKEELSNNTRIHYSPCDEWEDFKRVNYIGADANSNYKPYLDVSRIFNDYGGTNNDYET
ncbi:hypothetical protein Tco_1257556 [Tanacetum coccineum]